MAELAGALDSGSVTSVKALTTCYKSRFGDLTPYKNQRTKRNSESDFFTIHSYLLLHMRVWRNWQTR